jgi:hypothetical protein
MTGEVVRGYEEEAAALYALPPSRFVTARDLRVAQLKRENQAILAGRLKLLRRPTLAAWCVNLLAASHAVELRALVDLGGELAAAQRRADPAAIRTLSLRRRNLVAELVGAAAREVGTELDANVVADVEATLNAAVADAAVAERVLSGRLARGESFAGFGPLPEPGGVAPAGGGGGVGNAAGATGGAGADGAGGAVGTAGGMGGGIGAARAAGGSGAAEAAGAQWASETARGAGGVGPAGGAARGAGGGADVASAGRGWRAAAGELVEAARAATERTCGVRAMWPGTPGRKPRRC